MNLNIKDYNKNERLREAKIEIDWVRKAIPVEVLPHIDWLIEQAERVQELEEALEFYANEDNYKEMLVSEAKYFKRLTALDADKRCSILSMLFGLLEAEKRVKELEAIEKLVSRFELEGGESTELSQTHQARRQAN